MTATNNAKTRFIIDYLSLSWTPEAIDRVKCWARTACDLRHCVDPSGPKFCSENSPARVQEAYRVLANELELPAFPDPAAPEMPSLWSILNEQNTFSGVFTALLNLNGLSMFDSLCRGDVFGMVSQLNKLGAGFRWELIETGRGMFGYPYSASLRCDGAQAGVVAWGAKNFGCYLSLSGEGCAALDMRKMHQIAQVLPGVKLTRVDVAFDDFSGQVFNVDICRKMAKAGLFCGNGKPPRYTYIEGGQMVKDAKGRCKLDKSGGRSFYVGSRQSGKMLRTYEKGKQLQCAEHPDWVRGEVELRNINREIPFDVLLDPATYFSGAYPALDRFHVDSTPIKTTTVKYKVTLEKAFDVAAVQYGKLVNFMKSWGMAPAEIVERLTGHLDSDEFPDRLIIPVPDDSGEMALPDIGPQRYYGFDTGEAYQPFCPM